MFIRKIVVIVMILLVASMSVPHTALAQSPAEMLVIPARESSPLHFRARAEGPSVSVMALAFDRRSDNIEEFSAGSRFYFLNIGGNQYELSADSFHSSDLSNVDWDRGFILWIYDYISHSYYYLGRNNEILNPPFTSIPPEKFIPFGPAAANTAPAITGLKVNEISLQPSSPAQPPVVSGPIVVTGTVLDAENNLRSVFAEIFSGPTRDRHDFVVPLGLGTYPIEWEFDSIIFPNGIATLIVEAEDAESLKDSFTQQITINNTAPNQPPDNPVITSPTNGMVLSGTVAITGTASDPDNNLASVGIRLQNQAGSIVVNANAIGTSQWSYSLDTTNMTDGEYSIIVFAEDAAGLSNPVQTEVHVIIQNQPAAPTMPTPSSTPNIVPNSVVLVRIGNSFNFNFQVTDSDPPQETGGLMAGNVRLLITFLNAAGAVMGSENTLVIGQAGQNQATISDQGSGVYSVQGAYQLFHATDADQVRRMSFRIRDSAATSNPVIADVTVSAPPPSPPVTSTDATCGISIGDNIRLRTGTDPALRIEAGLASQTILTLPAGAEAETEGKTDRDGFLWWKVNYQGTHGWVVGYNYNTHECLVEKAEERNTCWDTCVARTRIGLGRITPGYCSASQDGTPIPSAILNQAPAGTIPRPYRIGNGNLCSSGQSCWCVDMPINENPIDIGPLITAIRGNQRITGGGAPASWADPEAMLEPPTKQANEYDCALPNGTTLDSLLSTTTMSSEEGNLLVEAGEQLTVSAYVGKQSSSCNGFQYKCRAQFIQGCELDQGFWKTTNTYKACPADYPDTRYEEGEESRRNWAAILALSSLAFNFFGGPWNELVKLIPGDIKWLEGIFEAKKMAEATRDLGLIFTALPQHLPDCFRVCTRDTLTQVTYEPRGVCSGYVVDANPGDYWCSPQRSELVCGGFESQEVNIKIKDAFGAVVADTASSGNPRTGSNGTIDYTFNAPVVEGGYNAVITIVR